MNGRSAAQRSIRIGRVRHLGPQESHLM
jgi:hypothetical protein